MGFHPAIREALEEIRGETTRGAAWSAFRAIKGLLDAYDAGGLECSAVDELSNAIISSNPSMASLYWVAWALVEGCRTGDPGPALRRLLFELQETRRRIPDIALEIFKGSPRILTMSYSSNVEAVLLAAHRSGSLGPVYVLESRPGGEGVVLASRLRARGVPVQLIPDALLHVYAERADFALVGADSVTLDGCLVNKAGTRLLALTARALGKHVAVVFEPYKIHPERGCGEVPLLERIYRVEGWGDTLVPVFDETPGEFLSLGITSEGLGAWEPGWIREVYESFRERILR